MQNSGKMLMLCVLILFVASCQSTRDLNQGSEISYEISHEIDLSSAEISQLELRYKKDATDHKRTFQIARAWDGRITAITFQDERDFERDLVSGQSYDEFMLADLDLRVEYPETRDALLVMYSQSGPDTRVDIRRR